MERHGPHGRGAAHASRWLLLAAALALLLGGCVEGPEDCATDEVWNPHESFCGATTDGSAEQCRAWASGNVDEQRLDCNVLSRDGALTIDYAIGGINSFNVAVRDPGGVEQHRLDVSDHSGGYHRTFSMSGPPGTWSMHIHVEEALGGWEIWLWG